NSQPALDQLHRAVRFEPQNWGSSRATAHTALSCNAQVYLLLYLSGTHPHSTFSLQVTKTARRLHAAARCTLPHLVDMDSALLVVEVYSLL
ncbi:hypothetical protein EJ02DRAFT_330954, partial [Clathrospora elynae]